MNYLDLDTQQKADLVLNYLKEDYPQVRTPLVHRNAFEFLISVMLSPQTNDEITNQVTPGLFEVFDTPEKLASASEEEVFELIKRVNYNRTKSKRIIDAANVLVSEFNSKVPATMAELLSLPGVGRKVANVIINDWYATPEEVNQPYPGDNDPNRFNTLNRGEATPTGFVVDTHVARVSKSLLLTEQKTPDKIEQDLVRLYDSSEWMGLSLRMIFHGREVFQAKNPQYKSFPRWNEIYSQLG